MRIEHNSVLASRTAHSCLWAVIVTILSLLLCACGQDEPYAGVDQGAVALIVPADASPTTSEVAGELSSYLASLLGTAPSLHELEASGGADGIAALSEAERAGLTIVLDADFFGSRALAVQGASGLSGNGYVLTAQHAGGYRNRLDARIGGTTVLLAAPTPLGKRYAAYELLRRLGVRFFHPEEEFIPRLPAAQVQARANTPTVLARVDSRGAPEPQYQPDYAQRSFTFHGSHPLEHLESFSDSRHPIDEARNVNLWIVKNRGNRFRGAGRGIAPAARKVARAQELDALRIRLGMPSTAGITLHNQQQGASAVVDPNLPVPPKQQIESYVDQRLEDAGPDLVEFGIHFGPTEVTVTPDLETVDWINWAGRRVLQRRPDLRVLINNHTTGSQATPNFSNLDQPRTRAPSGGALRRRCRVPRGYTQMRSRSERTGSGDPRQEEAGPR